MGGFCKDEFSGIIFLGWTFPGGSGAPSTGRVWGWDLLTAAVGLFVFFWERQNRGCFDGDGCYFLIFFFLKIEAITKMKFDLKLCQLGHWNHHSHQDIWPIIFRSLRSGQ